MNADEAKLKQADALLANTDALLAKLRVSLKLELVEGLPEQVDGFNPERLDAFPNEARPTRYRPVRVRSRAPRDGTSVFSRAAW